MYFSNGLDVVRKHEGVWRQTYRLARHEPCPIGTSVTQYIHHNNTKITEVNLSVFVYRLFHEDFSPIIGTNLDDSSTIFMPYIQQFSRVSEWVVFMISYSSADCRPSASESVGSSVLVVAGEYDLEIGHFKRWLAW